MKAIETSYKGYRFRSRTEARWAIFFDTVGVSYQYEPEGFDLGEHGCYLPDFYIPSANTWIEIKGCQPTEHELELAFQLYSQSNDSECPNMDLIYLVVEPRRVMLEEKFPDRLEAARKSKKVVILCGSPGDRMRSHFISTVNGELYSFPVFEMQYSEMVFALGGKADRIESAVNKSRAARFEFADSKKPWRK